MKTEIRKAMVLAAGLGTRLRPLTNDRPKALVELNGRTLLEITLAHLREFGVREVIVNVHHFAGMMIDYLKRHNNFGMRIEISREEELLDTGGGLKKAAWFFQNDDAPFILYNVDVVSNIDLRRMVQFHIENQALATLAVQSRESGRYLLFDEQGQLCGRRFVREQRVEWAKPSTHVEERAFAGIHAISPAMLPMMSEEGAFSIIAIYLRLAGEGRKITAFPADEYYWRDLGTAESLSKAAEPPKPE